MRLGETHHGTAFGAATCDRPARRGRPASPRVPRPPRSVPRDVTACAAQPARRRAFRKASTHATLLSRCADADNIFDECHGLSGEVVLSLPRSRPGRHGPARWVFRARRRSLPTDRWRVACCRPRDYTGAATGVVSMLGHWAARSGDARLLLTSPLCMQECDDHGQDVLQH